MLFCCPQGALNAFEICLRVIKCLLQVPRLMGILLRFETRLLTRLLEEVWFPGHACHALGTSLFTSLFAGKREVPPPWVG